MGETAESVVLQIDAKLDNYRSQMTGAANVSEQAFNRISSSATAAEATVGKAFNGMRGSQMEMMHVSRALGDSFAAGIPLQQAFAMEIGRIGEAAAMSGGSLGALGKFLAGPWGMAVTLGVTVLASLAGKLGDTEEATKKAKQAEEEYAKFQTTLANFIDGANGKLRERLRLLAEVAIRENAAKVRENDKAAGDKSTEAFARARSDAPVQRYEFVAERQPQRAILDPSIVQAISGAGGDVGKLAHNMAQLAAATKSDEIRRYADSIAHLAGEALHAKDESAKLRGEQYELNKVLHGGTVETQEIADRHVALATATTKVEKAQARLNDVKSRGAEIEKMDGGPDKDRAWAKYEKDVIGATRALQAAQEAAKKTKTPDYDLTPFRLPVSGTRTGSFGEQRPGHRHAGLDIAVPVGTDVSAAAAGTVIEAGTLPGYGNVIIIDHGRGTTTRYAHLSKLLAQKGQAVDAGDVIALSGGAKGAPGAGDSTGPHVHYEVRRNGRAVDPRKGSFPTDQLATAREAQRAGQQQARDDKAYQAELATALDRYARAQLALAVTAEARYAIEIEELRSAKASRDAQISDELKAGKITAAEAERLKQLNADTEALSEIATKRRETGAIVDRELEHERTALSATLLILGLQQELATTTKDRRAIALQILEYQEREARATLAAAIAKENDPARKADLQTQMDTLAPEFALKRQGVERQTAGPLDTYRRQLFESTSDMSTALQSVAVHGFQALDDGLTSTIKKVFGLKGAFGDMASSVLADLAKIEIEKMILGAIGTPDSGGGWLTKLLNIGTKVAGAASGNITAGDIDANFGTAPGRAGGGPVVAGTLYRVNEAGMEGFRPAGGGTIVPLGQMAQAQRSGGTTVIQPIQFDLRGAVMTEDILAQMNALADQAATHGAYGGAALAQRQVGRAASRRLA